MRPSKERLPAIIKANILELQKGIDRHCALLDALVSDQDLAGKDVDTLVARCPVRDRETQLVMAIRQAIDVLEESRKSFKSRRLEGLRKDLTRVLTNQG